MNDMSIRGINGEFQRVLDEFNEGLITQEEFAHMLEALEETKVAKCTNAIRYLNMLSETIEGAKAEKKRIDCYIKSIESRKKGIEQAFMYALKQMGDKEVLTNIGAMKIRKNPPSVVIDDISKLDSKYTRQKIQIDVDKIAIKKAIQAGENVPGCRLEQTEKLVY